MSYKKSNANGQATMANSEPVVIASDQSTVPVSLASIPSHAVTNAGTFAVQNTAATPAGTNNIGDVDVLTVNGVAPAFGTGLRGATVQRVTIATDDSVPVTNAGITTIAGAVSGTEMQVDVLTMPTVTVNSHAVTNAGTFATQVDGAALTALQLIDDVVFAEDAAHVSGDKGVMALAVRKDTAAALATTDGDYSPMQLDADGGLRLSLTSSSGSVFASEDTLQIMQSNTQAMEDFVVPAFKTLGTDTYTEATTKGVVIGAVRRDADTTLVNTTNEVAPLQVDANGRLKVEAFSGETLPVSLASVPSHAVTNAGTFATQVDGSALTALQLIDDTVFADDAAVTLGSSKGNVAAGVAVATDGTDPTAVSAEGDAAALRTDMNRILLVNQTHPRFWHVSADYASAQTNASVKAAPGASLSLYITDISISNGATAGNITLLDGSGGTVLLEIYPAINGGAVLSLRNPIKLTANTALCLTSTSCTTHSIFVSGYIAP